MPVPKRKTSKKRRNQRSSSWGLSPKPVTGCPTCQAPVLSHQACPYCGYYKGQKILRTKADRMQERGEKVQARRGTQQQSANDNQTSSQSSE